MLSAGLDSNITRELVEKFIRRLNFTSVVNRGLESVFYEHRSRQTATDKNIDGDVAIIKEFLRTKIGSTYAEATAPCDENALGVDLTNWGGQRRARQQAPWEQMRAHEATMAETVEDVITSYCLWHKWQ